MRLRLALQTTRNQPKRQAKLPAEKSVKVLQTKETFLSPAVGGNSSEIFVGKNSWIVRARQKMHRIL